MLFPALEAPAEFPKTAGTTDTETHIRPSQVPGIQPCVLGVISETAPRPDDAAVLDMIRLHTMIVSPKYVWEVDGDNCRSRGCVSLSSIDCQRGQRLDATTGTVL